MTDVRQQHMMRLMAGLFVLALAVPNMARPASPPYSYAMDGDTFVQMLSKPEPLSSHHYLEREKAYSYLDGIKDASQGKIWCDINQLKTPDLAYDMVGEISRMQPFERKGSAATLLLNILRRKYPCH